MEQIRRTTLMDSVTEELRNAILNGEIGLGERVNESTFTTKLNISRTTFREAMRQLEQAGLLVRDPFRGTFVREFSESEIKDLNNLRGALEIYAAEIIIENGGNNPEKLLPLYEIVSQMEGIDPEEEVAQTNALHITFHRTLLNMAGNKLMFTVWNDLAQQFWVAMRLSQLSLVARGEGVNFAEAHREVVDAIAAGDTAQIHKIMHKHVS
ncbi:GntR family transcriptional regulator [Enterocloster bolteae]|uniref:GntR family transcriptional regulator n=1 Tax=Enterocloster bolteae TaxID=208479 RepID=UPI000E43A3E6|nr:GntR family transcriptional regulator [Enterocloster bolteae]RGK76553.1 GntR family transcriptional regulator [Enterocloster bolteae]